MRRVVSLTTPVRPTLELIMSTSRQASPVHAAPPASPRPAKRARASGFSACVYDASGVEKAVFVDGGVLQGAACDSELCKSGSCTCWSQAEVMGNLGYKGVFVWSYSEPDYSDGALVEASDVIGPFVCVNRVVEFGTTRYPDGMTIHMMSDTKQSPYVHEVVLDTNEQATYSAFCADCECRTSVGDVDGLCLVCDCPVVCPVCYESPFGKERCDACACDDDE